MEKKQLDVVTWKRSTLFVLLHYVLVSKTIQAKGRARKGCGGVGGGTDRMINPRNPLGCPNVFVGCLSRGDKMKVMIQMNGFINILAQQHHIFMTVSKHKSLESNGLSWVDWLHIHAEE